MIYGVLKGSDMPFLEKRKYKRRPFVKVLRYSALPIQTERIKKINGECVCIDISEVGLGMVTDHLLKRGNVLFFEPISEINGLKVKVSSVIWAKEIEGNIYRVGLEFRR